MLLAAAGLAGCATAGPGSDRTASLHRALQSQFEGLRSEAGQASADNAGLRYAHAFADLDGDGRDEAIVYLMGRDVCGSGGCDLLVLGDESGSWGEIARLTIANPPIRVLETRSEGWRDLEVFVAGGGVLSGYPALVPFSGTAYAPNPSVPPARRIERDKAGRTLIGRDDRGRALF